MLHAALDRLLVVQKKQKTVPFRTATNNLLWFPQTAQRNADASEPSAESDRKETELTNNTKIRLCKQLNGGEKERNKREGERGREGRERERVITLGLCGSRCHEKALPLKRGHDPTKLLQLWERFTQQQHFFPQFKKLISGVIFLNVLTVSGDTGSLFFKISKWFTRKNKHYTATIRCQNILSCYSNNSVGKSNDSAQQLCMIFDSLTSLTEKETTKETNEIK